MMGDNRNRGGYKTFVIFVLGFFGVALGVTLILLWWEDVGVLFRGCIGLVLALAGLLTMYAVKKVNR